MAAVHANHGSAKGNPSGDATAAMKPNHHGVVNGGRDASNGAIPNGESHPERSNLTVVHRPRPIQATDRYKEECRRINSDALDATTSMKSFYDFVAKDRLRRMPHKGSRWDKILRWAEYFAAQVSLYQESVGRFVPNSEETAVLLWASCRILLQVSICGPVGGDEILTAPAGSTTRGRIGKNHRGFFQDEPDDVIHSTQAQSVALCEIRGDTG